MRPRAGKGLFRGGHWRWRGARGGRYLLLLFAFMDMDAKAVVEPAELFQLLCLFDWA